MTKSNAPRILWDHSFQLQAEICSHTALDLFTLGGDTPTTKLLGDTADISHLCQFEWYQYVWFIHPSDKLDSKHIGRYLGPSHLVGDVTCSKVLTSKATVLVRSSVYPVSHEDLVTSGVNDRLLDFGAQLREKLKDRYEPLSIEPEVLTYTPYEDIESQPLEMPEAGEMDHAAYDNYISARVWLPTDDGIAKPAKVTGRKRDTDGNLIGHTNDNPILDTSLL
jgi:hypothetical protein